MRYLKALQLILTLRCDQSERLISLGLDEELSTSQRWAVKTHFISCKYCRRFRQHVELIRSASHQLATVDTQVLPHALTSDARERITNAIRNAGHQ